MLSSAIGSGHMRASAALSKGVFLLDPGCECLILDFPKEVSPAMEALLRRAYLESLKFMPDAYGRLYRMSELRTTNSGESNWTSDGYENLPQ